MRPRTLAHLSDLHFGRSAESDDRNRALARLLLSAEVDHVVVTGDITHRGRFSELGRFAEAYAPLIKARRLSVVPGNHDRLGEDAGASFLRGQRVLVDEPPGLYIVRLDSTGPHNRNPLASHGLLTSEDIRAVAASFDRAPGGSFRMLLLHHHPLPLPEESLSEALATRLGMPDELERGQELLSTIAGKCDLVLHGHRHRPRAHEVFTGTGPPLNVWNAGSAPELGRVRVLRHQTGNMLDWSWVAAPEIQSAPRRMGFWALTEGAALFLA
jgi:3',5'-cyclic AMP phosphodiesterase CpdA